MSYEDPPPTTRKRAMVIKKRYLSVGMSTASRWRFGRLFTTSMDTVFSDTSELHYHDCSEGFTVDDVEKLISLSCELELDHCTGFEEDYQFNCAPLHAMNALLLLVASDKSLADTVARRLARRCAESVSSLENDFLTEVMGHNMGHNMVMLLCECGPPAIPYLITEMRKLILSLHAQPISWFGASYVSRAVLNIIRECYKDIPLAISLTDQCCAPLLEFGHHPTAALNPVNQENASYFLSKLVEVAILITDEKEVLELCRSNKCNDNGFDHSWLDVLRSFSLEPHPQDELLRVRGNRLDWVIQTWNENHPDKQFPFPRGVVDGPFPGQPGYELPKRLFRHKYCRNPYKCVNESAGSSHTPVGIKVCDRCKHTYYCSDICQREGWYCRRNGEADQFPRDSFPSKFLVRPLKRLLPESRSWLLSHRHQCLLIQAYKRWVKIQKQERSAGVNEDEEQATAADEG